MTGVILDAGAQTALDRLAEALGSTAVTDPCPARRVHGRDRMATGASMDGSST
jgi:hypothetical protein